MLQIFIAEPDGSIPICEAGPERTRRDSFLPVIQEKLNDAKCSTSELLRLISAEIAQLIVEIGVHQEDPQAGYRLPIFRGQLKTLRALAGSLLRIEAQRKKEDQLDFDGPKFRYVFGELVKCLEQAMQETLGQNDPAAIQTAKRHFRDIITMREPDLRLEVKRM